MEQPTEAVQSSTTTTTETSSETTTTNDTPLDARPRWSMDPSHWKHSCHIYTPTLEQLQSQTFDDYVRNTVLEGSSLYERHEDYAMEWNQGMAKVCLPLGWNNQKGIACDPSGRGPVWQKGHALGDWPVQSPIQQHIRGLAGTYEYVFTLQKPCSMAEFRDKADTYREQMLGQVLPEQWDQETVQRVADKFWKRLGPTMPAPWYGADQEGSLFGDDEACGWSLQSLDSCLQLLDSMPGVTTPYLYAGMFASVFCVHAEDMNLLSINYLHVGAPKIWYAVAPGIMSERLEALANSHFSTQYGKCKEYLRHKGSMLSPKVLEAAGIEYTSTIQMPGDAIITFPGGYHFGFNAGFNVAEATNFGVPEWIPYGRKAGVCMCRPESVRIDMDQMQRLLDEFEREKKRDPGLSWSEWADYKYAKKNKDKKGHGRRMVACDATKQSTKKQPKQSDQERRGEFWIEVMKPLKPGELRAIEPEEPDEPEGEGRSKRKRKPSFKVRDLEDREREKEREAFREEEVWHLAKPVGKKGLAVGRRVLAVVPGIAVNTYGDKDADDEDEHCFCGQVSEVADDHVRIRIDGLGKKDDVWMPVHCPKLYVDGGRWTEKQSKPRRHYWKVMDSKRRCVD